MDMSYANKASTRMLTALGESTPCEELDVIEYCRAPKTRKILISTSKGKENLQIDNIEWFSGEAFQENVFGVQPPSVLSNLKEDIMGASRWHREFPPPEMGKLLSRNDPISKGYFSNTSVIL